MRSLFVLFLLFGFMTGFGQGFSYPVVQSKAQNIDAFVPAGWMLLDSATGDLNKDGLVDAALVLQHKDSVSIVNEEGDSIITQPRMLLLLFKNASGALELAAESRTFILQHESATIDDPYVGISISNGVLQMSFRIFHNVGSWYVTTGAYKFRHNNGQFLLIGADHMSLHRASLDYETYSYNFLTRKRSYVKGNEEKGTAQESWKTFQLTTPKTLKTFQKPFSWEVEKNIFL